jgi:hypothetical protein
MHRMLVVLSLCLAGCATVPPAQRAHLDSGDAGVYGLIHKDGHLTDKRYRLTKRPDRWVMEDKLPDGSWEDFTCEKDCLLRDSTESDIASWMGRIPEGASVACVHNTAFALCRFMRAGSEERRYRLIALITGTPIPLWLQRLEEADAKAAR